MSKKGGARGLELSSLLALDDYHSDNPTRTCLPDRPSRIVKKEEIFEVNQQINEVFRFIDKVRIR